MKVRFKNFIDRGPSVTVQGVWLALAETPGPIFMPINAEYACYRGDTMEITVDFDELIDTVGTIPWTRRGDGT